MSSEVNVCLTSAHPGLPGTLVGISLLIPQTSSSATLTAKSPLWTPQLPLGIWGPFNTCVSTPQIHLLIVLALCFRDLKAAFGDMWGESPSKWGTEAH